MKRFDQKRILAILLVIVMVLAGTGMATAKPANAGNGNSWKTTAADVDGENAAKAANNGRAVGKTRNDAKAQALHDLNLFKGTSIATYKPDLLRAATRIEAIKLIGVALGWDVQVASFKYSDIQVPADVAVFVAAATSPEDKTVREEMARYVQYALALGVTKGIGGNKFGANLPVNARMTYTWYARALMYEDDVWTNPENLVKQGLLTQTQYEKINWDDVSLRDDLVGVMYDAMKWKIKGTEKKLFQMLLKNQWFDYKAAVKAGLMDPEETEMSYVVRQLGRNKLQLTFSHVLEESSSEISGNYTIRVQHHPYGAPVPETVSGGAIVTTPGAITVDGFVDPDDYTAELFKDGDDENGNVVILTFEDDFLVRDRVYVTPSQDVVSKFYGYMLDEDRATRLIVIW